MSGGAPVARSEKKFLQKGERRKKKSLRFSRVVPARGPAGWAGGRAGGQVGGVGWHWSLRCSGPVAPPSPPHTPLPLPSFQPWTTHPEPCAPTEVRGGPEGRPPGSDGGGGCGDAPTPRGGGSPYHTTRRPGAQGQAGVGETGASEL